MNMNINIEDYLSQEVEIKFTKNDEEFRRYINDDCDVCDIPNCNVDLETMFANYLGID